MKQLFKYILILVCLFVFITSNAQSTLKYDNIIELSSISSVGKTGTTTPTDKKIRIETIADYYTDELVEMSFMIEKDRSGHGISFAKGSSFSIKGIDSTVMYIFSGNHGMSVIFCFCPLEEQEPYVIIFEDEKNSENREIYKIPYNSNEKLPTLIYNQVEKFINAGIIQKK